MDIPYKQATARGPAPEPVPVMDTYRQYGFNPSRDAVRERRSVTGLGVIVALLFAAYFVIGAATPLPLDVREALTSLPLSGTSFPAACAQRRRS